MHGRRRAIVPVVLVIAIAVVAGIWYLGRPAEPAEGTLAATGTIEATSVTVAPEVAGRVLAVAVAEGDAVAAGDVMVTLDGAVVEAQRDQADAAVEAARAALATAEAAVDAAQADLALVTAGPSAEQLAVARSQLGQAQDAHEIARDAYADLSGVEKDSPAGIAAKAQRGNARAAVATARAQYDLVAAGARPEQVAAAEARLAATTAQVDAARAQVRAAEAALAVVDAQVAKLSLVAPVAGTVLSRTVEPGEAVTPGAVLLVLGDLDRLAVTVYVPEDRLGEVVLGSPVTVSVDSFPGEAFGGTVRRIADEAEFTPRNVQTVEGRKTTVVAIELALEAADGRLKPGMPADVVFGP